MQQPSTASKGKGKAADPASRKTSPFQEETKDFAMDGERDKGDFTIKGIHDKADDSDSGNSDSADSGLGAVAAKPGTKERTQPLSKSEAEGLEKKRVAAAPEPAVPNQAVPTEKTKATILGDYKLIKKLGQGGMGAVYKALKISLDREVAIKILNKELAAKPAFVQRFLREARVMAKLDHVNILRCFDVGEAHGFHFLTMEYVDGGSIETWLKKLGKFSIPDSLHIALSTAAALQHAHELNMIHRDIKPDNILLTKKGVVKVADLGLAKAIDDDLSLTKTGTGAGTPIYMAPEQARDAKHVDGRVDIYALGCMLYVFLTGQIPFTGETLVELIESKEKDQPKPMRSWNDEVPERLDLIVDKMMAKKPEHRYATCDEVIADLEALGLAGNRLSFFSDDSAKAAPASKAVKPAPQTVSAPSKAPSTSVPNKTPLAEEPYFWSFEGPAAKMVTKKVTKDQLLTLLKSGALDAQAQVSRTVKGGYRALGTFAEFQHVIQGAVTKEKAEKKTEKFKSIYDKLEKEEKSRKRWRFIHNIYLKTGGLIGLLLWLVIVGAILVAGYYGVHYLITLLSDRVRGAANV